MKNLGLHFPIFNLKRFSIGLISGACLISSIGGCASLSRNGGQHAVFINSTPSGARIISDGEALGETPSYVILPRTRSPEITLQTTKETRTLELEKNYRWKASFFSNLIWLSYAPFGWLIDLATGSAWETHDLLDAKLQGEGFSKKVSSRSTSIAIAPPQAETIAISDAAARALEKNLTSRDGRSGQLEIKGFDETLPTFVAHHYDYDGKPNEQSDYRDLLHALSVDEILESQVLADRHGNLTVKAERLNVFDDRVSDKFDLQLRPESEIDRVFVRQSWLRRLLPNSIGIDFANEELKVTRGNEVYPFTPIESDAWWATGVSYLSAISVSNIPERRAGRAARWQFTFVPSARISGKNVKLEDPRLLETREFVRWRVSGGYGGELGVQVSRHYFYFNLIPVLTWSELSWKKDGIERSTTITGVLGQSELGYLVFYDSNWALRLFVRSTSDDQSSWTQALEGVLPPITNPQTPESALITPSSTMAGLSISYRFDPRLKPDTRAKTKTRKRRPAFFD